MIDVNKYQEELNQLGIYDKEEQIDVLNSLMRFAIIAQNNYKKINGEHEEE